jgi:hypothetical protein
MEPMIAALVAALVALWPYTRPGDYPLVTVRAGDACYVASMMQGEEDEAAAIFGYPLLAFVPHDGRAVVVAACQDAP